MSASSSLGRRASAEGLGTGFLGAVVVGSGIAAQRLSPDAIGLQLLGAGLAVAVALILFPEPEPSLEEALDARP